MLKDVYKVGLEAGADTIMLLSDDFVPHTGKNRDHYSLYTLVDKNRFVNLQNAQAHLIKKLKQWIDTDYPELSLWKVLSRTYGPAVANNLIHFSDAYYGIYGTCLRMEFAGIKDKYINTGKSFLNDLDNLLLNISQALPENHPLLKELKKFRDKQNNRFEKLSQGEAKKESAAE